MQHTCHTHIPHDILTNRTSARTLICTDLACMQDTHTSKLVHKSLWGLLPFLHSSFGMLLYSLSTQYTTIVIYNYGLSSCIFFNLSFNIWYYYKTISQSFKVPHKYSETSYTHTCNPPSLLLPHIHTCLKTHYLMNTAACHERLNSEAQNEESKQTQKLSFKPQSAASMSTTSLSASLSTDSLVH